MRPGRHTYHLETGLETGAMLRRAAPVVPGAGPDNPEGPGRPGRAASIVPGAGSPGNSAGGRGLRRVQVGETVIEYRVRRSRRRKKTLQISVNNDGVLVAAPARTPEREVREVVLRRASWIIRHLAARTPEPEPLRLVSGERLPYRGQSLELVVRSAPEVSPNPASGGSGGDLRPNAPEVSLAPGRLTITVPGNSAAAAAENPELLREALLRWYRERAAEEIQQEAQRWWPELGRGDAPRILIRNQRRRWGSCAPDGVLRFNWRLAMLEPALTEYVVVHELAHLTHMNHSAQFWELVSRHLPDVPERRQRLKEAGRGLPR